MVLTGFDGHEEDARVSSVNDQELTMIHWGEKVGDRRRTLYTATTSPFFRIRVIVCSMFDDQPREIQLDQFWPPNVTPHQSPQAQSNELNRHTYKDKR